MNNFFTSVETPFYKQVSDWVSENKNHEFYILPTSQNNENIYDFCSAVLKENKTPVLITPLTGWDATYPSAIQVALKLSDKVRIYESAKMGMMIVLENRAKQFIKINGGVIWTQ
tara:strand:+ start:487 stop:828 length:342 start_codon:yes stop_codon:yes gene_type:complete